MLVHFFFILFHLRLCLCHDQWHIPLIVLSVLEIIHSLHMFSSQLDQEKVHLIYIVLVDLFFPKAIHIFQYIILKSFQPFDNLDEFQGKSYA